MELSVFVAKVVALIYIAGGIAIATGALKISEITEDLLKTPALLFISGCVGIMIGMVLIERHNIWVKDWTVMITVISWMFLIGGFVIAAFPKTLSLVMKFSKDSPLWGLFMIAFGLLFGYFGFFH